MITSDPQELAARTVVPSAYHVRKAFWDRLAGGALLVLSAPIIAALVILVRTTSRGGGIYRQQRVGKNGRLFNVLKIRTMYCDAEAAGPQWAVRKDARITPIGRALRFLHLDELPQLLNVARGEMSLIGPRPERPIFVKQLEASVPHYADRLLVHPGITGLAQINLPPDESVDCVRKKTLVDCHYVAHATLGLDVRIFVCTLLRMLGVRHGRAPRWLGVEFRFDAPAPPSAPATPAQSSAAPRPVVVLAEPKYSARKRRAALVATAAGDGLSTELTLSVAEGLRSPSPASAPNRPR